VRLPAFGEPAHLLLLHARGPPEETDREVLHDAEVPRREDVQAPQSAQERDLRRPAADAVETAERLDRRLVRQRRERSLDESSLGKGEGEAPDRRGLGAREPKPPQSPRGEPRQGRRRGEVDVDRAADARPPPQRESELAADVIREAQVDLLAEDRGDERLPQRRIASDAESSEVPNRRREQRIRGAGAIELREADVGARSRPERTLDQPARGDRGRGRPGSRALEAHLQHGAVRPPALEDLDERGLAAREDQPPVGPPVEAVDDFGKAGKPRRRQGERIGAARHDSKARRGLHVRDILRNAFARRGEAMRFLLRLLINAAALWVALRLLPGITYDGNGWLPFFGVALVFGLVNAFIRPVLKLLSLPLIFLTLGLFALVVNGAMLWLTGKLSGALGLGFHVDGCWTAILGALIVSIVSALLSVFLAEVD